MTQLHPRATEIITFWRDAGPEAWFKKDDGFDARLRETFYADHFAAARREHDDWLDHPDGSLALMILLDQYPRNSFRGTGHMYATDPLALAFARRADALGHDGGIDPALRVFLYLPYSHSEVLADQERAVELNKRIGEPYLHHAVEHFEVVARFGRFPHRNTILARQSTPEELAFLAKGGFAG